MTEFVAMWTTRDRRNVALHAFRRGEGSIRDENHVRDIMDCFARGNEDLVLKTPPDPGETPLFEIHLRVAETRHGGSNYSGWDYRMYQDCPHRVAEAGMDIYQQIKALLKKARIRKEGRKK